ncbi:MAG: ABC transporter substrate-binding protein [Synergistaceae bacterium]|jgi:NitT/TauT family transport system substrate-binding protein|nr:ABC transporter substrate-binding protein [Synergistaceae bacterium]
MSFKKIFALTLVIFFISTLFTGVSHAASEQPEKKLLDRPLIIGHKASACESYFFAAEKLGLFAKNGLDVEFLRVDTATAREGIVSGKIDITDGVLQQWLKPIEMGMDIKFTLGLHQGCMSTVVKADSPYKDIKDLKGKTIGVSAPLGGGPQNYLYRYILHEGLDPAKDYNWVAIDSGSLMLALDTDKVDAVIGGDTSTYPRIKTGNYRYITLMATDEYLKDETCCLLAFSPVFIKEHKDIARIVTKILYEASKWVNTHKEEAVQYEFEKGYINGTLEDNLSVITPYDFNPGVKIGVESFKRSFVDYQAVGIIDKNVKLETVLDRAFVIFDDPEIQ